MKASIYNPYWDTLGGGERYTASLISMLLKKGYKVEIEWNSRNLITKLNSRFNIDISKSKVVETINRGDGYDFCFWLSDGSIPTLKSRINILHFQFPFQHTHQNVLFNKMKFFRIKSIICNSNFTKSFIDKEYNIKSDVIYPPVDISSFKPGKKENIILYVGRFSQLTQSKNQHILVRNFKRLYDSGFKKWSLVLAGGGEIGAAEYIEELKLSAKAYPISIVVSPSFNKLKELYSKSKIFWSAVGLLVDEIKEPLRVEHFGMTLVEAMSSGVIPVVPAKGGYTEIIKDNENGFFYSSEDELIQLTESIIKERKNMIELSRKAIYSSESFDTEHFEKSFSKYL